MTSLGQKTTNILAGAAFSLAALTPQFATQAHADEVKVAAMAAPTVVIEYGDKLEDVDFVVDDMKSLGINVKLQSGYINASCGRVTVNGKSVEFDQDSIYGGDLGSFIHMQTLGKKVYDMPKCDGNA